jgi:hypothetical protein
MGTREIRRRACRLALAGLATAAGFSFEAKAAPVQACVGPLEQPGIVYDWMTGYFSSFFPLDDKTCEKLTKRAVEACHRAVSNAKECQSDLIRSTHKASKVACGTEGPDKDSCNDTYKNLHEELKDFLKEQTEEAHDECDTDFADDFFLECTEV